jgi:TRAP-type C4-dicarboxylate transport system permease small subunit
MNSLSRLVVAAVRSVNRATLVACALLMLALTVVVLLQVLYRYVLELPLTWSDEAARHLLVWLSFIGGGIAIARQLNPRIEIIDSLCPPRVRRGIEIAISMLVLGFLACFLVISFDVARTYNAYRSLSLGLPQSVPRLALPVGACLMALNAAARLLEQLTASATAPTDAA